MKLLFCADIHIKLNQKNVPVDWATNRFRLFIEQLSDMQSQADMVILGGDTFDRVPTVDELELYFELVASFKKPTIIISGNHEALKKSTTFLSNLKNVTNRLNKLVRIVDDIDSTLLGGDIDIIPYNKLKEWAESYQDYDFYGRICVSHFRAEIPPHVKPEVNLDLFNRWEIVLAGDLHSYENSQRNILYPGSPYTTSFHRSHVNTGAILLDTETLDHEWLQFKLPQLIKKTVGVNDPKPQTPFDHTIYEVQGDMQELGAMEDSALIASKVIKRDSDTALILDPEMDLVEEIREYLTYIQALPETTVEEVIKEFKNHANKIESD